jgi:hypothetical protein
MAASMAMYRAERNDTELPEAFTPLEFKAQLRQMLGRFELHGREYDSHYYDNVDKTYAPDAAMTATEFSKLELVAKFDALLEEGKQVFLLEWDATDLPFALGHKL